MENDAWPRPACTLIRAQRKAHMGKGACYMCMICRCALRTHFHSLFWKGYATKATKISIFSRHAYISHIDFTVQVWVWSWRPQQSRENHLKARAQELGRSVFVCLSVKMCKIQTWNLADVQLSSKYRIYFSWCDPNHNMVSSFSYLYYINKKIQLILNRKAKSITISCFKPKTVYKRWTQPA